MARIVFATAAQSLVALTQALLLARSLRAFGGALAGQPFWVYVPCDTVRSDPVLAEKLAAAGATTLDYTLDEEAAVFPFAPKTIAAGLAEDQAAATAPLLAWMDPDTLVLQEPSPLLLAAAKSLGCRPVDHTLIGSRISTPPDAFWTTIYDRCGILEDHLPTMTTSVDQQAIRPYFNAGLLVVRPQLGLLRAWSDAFLDVYLQPAYTVFYEQSPLYRIFLHQAMLAGVILARLAPADWLELPARVNYPLHMHADYPPAGRARRLNDLVTCRYDSAAPKESWAARLAIDEPLRGWLAAQRSDLFSTGSTT